MNQSILRQFIVNPVYWLLPLGILAVVLHFMGSAPVWILLVSALAMIPFAGLIGEATEAIAAHAGPQLGGLLNATFGNAAELIITIVAIRRGLLELVKASITGSILGNMLVVLGLSMLAGGLRNGVQRFDRDKASSDSILLILAVVALTIPSFFSQAQGGIADELEVEALSLGVAGLMIVIYVLGLVYGFRPSESPLTRESADPLLHKPAWSVRASMILLAAATLSVVVLSELLVGQVESVVAVLGVSEFFLGVILVPIVGNVAEHMVAVSVAAKNHIRLSVEIAVGSSLQVALFVAPILVFLSLAIGNPLTLVFNHFELVALIGGVLIVALVAFDGKANWLEGAVLTSLYLMLALAFFFLH
jgi:Ca2+:H+ antiporter